MIKLCVLSVQKMLKSLFETIIDVYLDSKIAYEKKVILYVH